MEWLYLAVFVTAIFAIEQSAHKRTEIDDKWFVIALFALCFIFIALGIWGV